MSKDPSGAWKMRHKRWLRYVQGVVKATEVGSSVPLGPSPQPLTLPVGPAPAGEPLRVVVAAPHPDDEALIGALPLRLRLEMGARVTDCAITLGSNVGQRARRLHELESACRVLGYELVVPNHPTGFERVNLENRQARPEEWAAKVQVLSEILESEKPDVVFAPHAEDSNTTHVGTHFLVVDALGAYLRATGRGAIPLVETEFWHELAEPNLMVGVSAEIVAIQLMATAEHGGEVARNPYHLLQAARMMNNVRRGSEVVGGQGGPAYRFPFAELYRVTFMDGAEQIAPRPGGRVVGPAEKIDARSLFQGFLPEGC